MSEKKTNPGASVRARLLNRAKADKVEFQLLLTRFALERLLYRLSISPYRDQFLLKGALLFDLWFDEPHRPTRDVDFLGFGPAEIPRLEEIFRAICEINVKEDGITFDPNYPVLLEGMPAPTLRVYPRYTVIAEKFEAIVSLGMTNSRMKDFFDLWVLAQHSTLNPAILRDAITATFNRRGTALPATTAIGLSDEFAADFGKQTQWRAFIAKNRLNAPPLKEVVTLLRDFLTAALIH